MAAKVPIINEINLQQAHPNKSSSIEGKQTKKDDQQLDCASSTILQKRSNSSSRNDETKIEAEHAANMRLKFRKSHTCGSLFAKCNCSTTDESASIITARVQAATPTTTSSCLGLNVTSSAAAVNPFHLSISPTTTLSSSTSLCTRHTSSGISSLSTQTSSATSAHLSHDESISFDYEGAVGLETMPQLSFEHQVNNSDIQKSPRLTSKQLKVPSISTQIPVESNSNKEHLLSISSSPRKITERSSNTRKLVQSYSHPDTDFLFTKENNSKHFESHTTDSNQATLYPQNKYKRSSSPHIGNYQLLNVAIHPDFVVRVSPTHSPLSEHRRFRGNSTPKSSPSTPRSAQQKRRLLQRSHEIKSDGSTSGSDNSFDLDRHTITTTAIVQSRDKESSDTSNTLKEDKAEAIGKVDSSFNAAQKYFAESGILGPINTSSNLIRKTSKILQDSNVIEQVSFLKYFFNYT